MKRRRKGKGKNRPNSLSAMKPEDFRLYPGRAAKYEISISDLVDEYGEDGVLCFIVQAPTIKRMLKVSFFTPDGRKPESINALTYPDNYSCKTARISHN